MTASDKNARAKLFDQQYTNIIFLILSVVQGLAFQDLATRTAIILPLATESAASLARFLHVVLCFCVLLRVFQTYVTAGLDYKPEFISFRDVVIILLAGILEYVIFQYVGGPGTPPTEFQPVKFYKSLAVLAALAAAVYYVNIFRIKLSERLNTRDYYLERRLQFANGNYMTAILAISLLVAAGWRGGRSPPTGVLIATSLTCSLLLVVSVANSLYKTFGVQLIFRSDERLALATGGSTPAPLPVDADVCVVTRATQDQSTDLVDLCLQRHEPVLTTLFGLIDDEAKSLLRRLVQGRWGAISYRNFLVASRLGVPVAAALVLTGRPSLISRASDLAKISATLGPMLTVRFRRRFRALELSELPLRGSGWWLISMVWSRGADRELAFRQILAEVVENARHDRVVDLVKVWCREHDNTLLQPLLAAGFGQDHILETGFDDATGDGRLLIFQKTVASGG